MSVELAASLHGLYFCIKTASSRPCNCTSAAIAKWASVILSVQGVKPSLWGRLYCICLLLECKIILVNLLHRALCAAPLLRNSLECSALSFQEKCGARIQKTAAQEFRKLRPQKPRQKSRKLQPTHWFLRISFNICEFTFLSTRAAESVAASLRAEQRALWAERGCCTQIRRAGISCSCAFGRLGTKERLTSQLKHA